MSNKDVYFRVFFQGLTVQVDESGNLIIARILGGSTAARQELLKTGEVILEVNGKRVRNPEELQQAIQDAKENLSLKLAPGIASDANRPLKSTVSATSCFSTSMPLVTTFRSPSLRCSFGCGEHDVGVVIAEQ